MIAYLEGKVISCLGNDLIIKTASGIGYKVHSLKIALEQSDLSLFIFHSIKETSQDLFGFASQSDRLIFEKLLSVKGVGPKSAFALMSSLGAERIVNSIKFEDTKTLSSAPGIGKKAAAQIILDLSSKLQDMILLPQASTIGSVNSAPINKIAENVLQACVELGFSRDDVWPSIIALNSDGQNWDETQMLTQILRTLKN